MCLIWPYYLFDTVSHIVAINLLFPPSLATRSDAEILSEKILDLMILLSAG